MYAIVEFENDDDEELSTHELAIVPLAWLQKNNKKCYWPITTRKMSFTDFVKKQTPYKKSWPIYKIFKVHFTTDSYLAAEEKLGHLLETNTENSETTDNSVKSYTLKFIEESDSSDPDDAPRKKTRELPKTREEADPEEAEDLISEINVDQNIDFLSQTDPQLNKPQRQQAAQGTVGTEPHVKLNVTHFEHDLHASSLSPASTETSISSIASCSRMRPGSYEESILNYLVKISNNIDNHSVILNELVLSNRKINTDKLLPPPNLPNFPISNHDEFISLNRRLETDSSLCDYMIKRLAAVGGSGVESLTRRILRFLITNEVAVKYNWKGRDKLSFEKTKIMWIIYEAAKINFPLQEKNDFAISNSVKDWLKFAKVRMTKKK